MNNVQHINVIDIEELNLRGLDLSRGFEIIEDSEYYSESESQIWDEVIYEEPSFGW